MAAPRVAQNDRLPRLSWSEEADIGDDAIHGEHLHRLILQFEACQLAATGIRRRSEQLARPAASKPAQHVIDGRAKDMKPLELDLAIRKNSNKTVAFQHKLLSVSRLDELRTIVVLLDQPQPPTGFEGQNLTDSIVSDSPESAVIPINLYWFSRVANDVPRT